MPACGLQGSHPQVSAGGGGLNGGNLLLKHMTDGWRGLTMVDEGVSVSISWVLVLVLGLGAFLLLSPWRHPARGRS